MVVSTLSHCAFLRALAYDMRWSVRCRRRKPMIRRRRLCGARAILVNRAVTAVLLRVRDSLNYAVTARMREISSVGGLYS